MKRPYILLLCCILFSSAAFTQSKTGDAEPAVRTYSASELAFKAGERLTMVANYKWGIISADAGEATMTIEQETFRDTTYFAVRLFVTSYKFWDNFFQLRNIYEGRFDIRTLRPYYFYRNISENTYKMVNSMHFNGNDYTIKSSTQRGKHPKKDTVLQGTAATYDLISLFFNSRNLDFSNLKEGKIFPFSFVIDDEIYDLYYRFVGREEKKISGLGRFRTLKFAVKVVAGEVFTGETELMLWITDDANRIPLLLQSPIRVGTVSARLSKYANLKYPLTSKIK